MQRLRACANACHEGAIGMVNGKAKLLRDDYCDGLGDCLPACPTNAISFVEREAAEYDRTAVEENMKRKAAQNSMPHHAGCPGAMMRQIAPKNDIADFESTKKCSRSFKTGLFKSNLHRLTRLISAVQIFLLRLTARHTLMQTSTANL